MTRWAPSDALGHECGGHARALGHRFELPVRVQQREEDAPPVRVRVLVCRRLAAQTSDCRPGTRAASNTVPRSDIRPHALHVPDDAGKRRKDRMHLAYPSERKKGQACDCSVLLNLPKHHGKMTHPHPHTRKQSATSAEDREPC